MIRKSGMSKQKKRGNSRVTIGTLARSISLLRSEVRINRQELREMRDEMHTGFDQLYRHLDGFVKLHETLDIEMKVMKEQMERL